MRKRYSRSRSYGRKRGKVTLRNHRHAIRPMRGLTSIPLRFRGRRIS